MPRSPLARAALLALAPVLVSCGGADGADEAADGPVPDASIASDTGTHVASDAATDGEVDAEAGAAVDRDAVATDAPSDAVADAPLEPACTAPEAAAAPLAAPDEQWTWIPVPGAKCRDGSDTGFAVNLRAAADEVTIFLEGGGACFNAVTCLASPSKFSEKDFDAWKGKGGKAGLFDRTNAKNPVKDHAFVYIPYCTGDVHAGSNPKGTPPAGTPQRFVGYANIALYLPSIVATFPAARRVLLSGVSAGGFGAALNYDQVQRAFGCIPVDLLDDATPPMASPYLPKCLQGKWRELWGLDATILADCGADCPHDDDFVLDWYEHIAKRHAERFQGFVESTQDLVFRFVYGFGANGCLLSSIMSGARFEAGLMDARRRLAAYPQFGTFLYTGVDHGSISSAAFYGRTTAGVPLTDWVADLLAGNARNVGP